MSIDLKQNPDGSLTLSGQDAGETGAHSVNIEYVAASIDKNVFVATRAYVVKAITGRPTVAGTDAGAVTAIIKKAASGTAITAGTAVHSGTYNLKGTADTVQELTVTAADALIPKGTCLGVDFTGVLTNATGVITVSLAPV